jgi:hypothetical protein
MDMAKRMAAYRAQNGRELLTLRQLRQVMRMTTRDWVRAQQRTEKGDAHAGHR